MWHEARKQEKIIRGIIVDYRRRAERRKNFYEKIKADPTQFIQIYGRPCKIHLDPAVATAVDSPGIMMPWQGDPNNLIDRFDVRAHLDYIPEVKNTEVSVEELTQEERQFNYERYRILAQNNFLGLSEAKFLQQLAVEEKFGMTHEEREAAKEKSNEKKGTGAAIGYNYSDPSSQPSSSTGPESKSVSQKDSDNDSDLEILDVDLSIDVNKMEASQAHELNAVGPLYGMTGCDMFSFLTGDADDVEHQKQMLREEKERAMFSGRKSRRERRAHRDKKLNTRVGQSPPSYAAPSSLPHREESRSPSRSVTPPVGDNIEFITSFGGDEEEKPPAPKASYAEKVKKNLTNKPLYAEVAKNTKRPLRSPSRERNNIVFGPHRPTYSRSPSRSRSRSYSRSKSRSRSRSKSRSRSRSKYRSYSRSRSRSYSKASYRGKSRSRSPNYQRRKRSRSISSNSEGGVGVSKCLPRYYGRKKDDKASSSELSIDSHSSDEDNSQKQAGNGGISNSNQSHLRSGSSNKGTTRETVSLKDKLKKKMQAQLSRQLRQDQRQEAERTAREERRQARREHEIRLLALKLRRKQREMRHQQRGSSYDSNSSGSGSLTRKSQDKDKRSESRSPSPPKKKIPVWTKDEVHTEYGCENRPYSYQEEGENNYPQNASRFPEASRQNLPEESRHNYSERYQDYKPDPDLQKYSDRYRENNRYDPQHDNLSNERYRGEPRQYQEDGGHSHYDRSRQNRSDISKYNYPENKTESRQNYSYPNRYNETQDSRQNYTERSREYKPNRGMDEHKQIYSSGRYDQRDFDNRRQEPSQGTSSQWRPNEQYNRQQNSFRGGFNKGFRGNDRKFNNQRNYGESQSWQQNRECDGNEESQDSKRVKLVDY